MKAILTAMLLLVLVPPAGAEIFLRGDAGWLDVEGGRMRGVGNPYQGGFGGGIEAGFGISHFLAVGAEFAPSYNQPARHTPGTLDLDHGSYSSMLGNIFFRLEPIGDVTPFFILGGGRSSFTFTFADGGKVFRLGGAERRLASDKLNAWAAIAGFGFESPLSSHFDWGFRVRYLYNRWDSLSREGVLYAYPQGDAASVDTSLKLHF